MAQADRGTKRRCPSCGAPYYDLNHDPAICPKCNTEYVATPRTPLRVVRGQAKVTAPPVEEGAVFGEDEVVSHDDDTEEVEETLLDGEGEEDSDEMRD